MQIQISGSVRISQHIPLKFFEQPIFKIHNLSYNQETGLLQYTQLCKNTQPIHVQLNNFIQDNTG